MAISSHSPPPPSLMCDLPCYALAHCQLSCPVFLGRCWPQIHQQCTPLLLRCKVMQFKKDIFERNLGPFPNCIPAIGEGSRYNWPNYISSSRLQRQRYIAELKKVNSSWKRKSKALKQSWQLFQHERDIARQNDLFLIKSNVPDLCLYSIDEVRWINKTYRALSKRLGPVTPKK